MERPWYTLRHWLPFPTDPVFDASLVNAPAKDADDATGERVRVGVSQTIASLLPCAEERVVSNARSSLFPQ